MPLPPLLFWLQPGVNPAGLQFLSNSSELLNWTKRLWLYSIPVSLECVFGLAVLLKQEGLSTAFPPNKCARGQHRPWYQSTSPQALF